MERPPQQSHRERAAGGGHEPSADHRPSTGHRALLRPGHPAPGLRIEVRRSKNLGKVTDDGIMSQSVADDFRNQPKP
jgi:hypothetical protein